MDTYAYAVVAAMSTYDELKAELAQAYARVSLLEGALEYLEARAWDAWEQEREQEQERREHAGLR